MQFRRQGTSFYKAESELRKIHTLKYRRYRRDMIELFKIVKGIYDHACIPHFDFMELSADLIRTRSNKYKLVQHHCYYDLRKFVFTNRVVTHLEQSV